MATETSALPRAPNTPRLDSMRMPADPWPNALAVTAHNLWRLNRQGVDAQVLHSGNPAEEYKSVCDFMRLYSTLRFYQLALLLGTTGSIVTAVSLNASNAGFAQPNFLKAGGLIVSMGFLVMEFRASSYWHRLRNRANVLAKVLQYEAFPAVSRWNPLTTSGVGFYLHAMVALLWLTSLLMRVRPGA